MITNIYRTLKEMFISRQIVRIQEGGTKELETGSALSQPKRSLEFAPLRLQPHLSLEPHDQNRQPFCRRPQRPDLMLDRDPC